MAPPPSNEPPRQLSEPVPYLRESATGGPPPGFAMVIGLQGAALAAQLYLIELGTEALALVSTVVVAIQLVLLHSLWSGRMWARMATLVLGVIDVMAGGVLVIEARGHLGAPHAGLMVRLALECFVLYFLTTAPSVAYFEAHGARPRRDL